MKKSWLALGMLLVTLPSLARADGGFNGYQWPGWKLSTSEGFNLETGDSNVRDNRVAFPLTQLLDGDPNTTWVWDDAAWKNRERRGVKPLKTRSLSLHSDKQLIADELWLMNGYNKRADLFKRNDRVVQIRINFDSKHVKTANLSDKMGWHKITLPRRAFKSLTVELTGIRKGAGPDNDICLSELALYNRGRKLNFQMPQAVVYSLAYCCGGTGWLLSRSGRVLTQGMLGEGASVEWSPDGRRVAGINGVDGKEQVWIADSLRPRIVRRVDFDKKSKLYSIRWKSNRTLEALTFDLPNGKYRERLLRPIHSPI